MNETTLRHNGIEPDVEGAFVYYDSYCSAVETRDAKIAELYKQLAAAREGLERIITTADDERGNAHELKDIAERTLERMGGRDEKCDS